VILTVDFGCIFSNSDVYTCILFPRCMLCYAMPHRLPDVQNFVAVVCSLNRGSISSSCFCCSLIQNDTLSDVD